MPAPVPSRAPARILVSAPILALVVAAATSAAADDPAAAAAPSYAQVKPIFDRACVHCHRAGRALGGLALDTHPAILRGVGARPALVAGHPERSVLGARIRGRAKPTMPSDGKPLPEADLRKIEAWIAAGAPGPAARGPVPAAAGASSPAEAKSAPEGGARDAAVPPEAASPDAPPLRWRDVAPILREACVRCHEGEASCAPSGLRYDTYAATIAGGTCVSVLPGHPEASALVRSMRADAPVRMPADGPPYASAEAIARLERWILEGARDDEGLPAPVPVGRPLCVVGPYDGRTRVGDVVVVVDAATVVTPCAAAGATVVAHVKVQADGSLHAEKVEGAAPAPAAPPPTPVR